MHPGAEDMKHLRNLVESPNYLNRIPAPELLLKGQGSGASRIETMSDTDKTFVMMYIPQMNQSITVDLSIVAGKKVTAWWYDPRNGVGTLIDTDTHQKTLEIKTPPYGPDWVLVLDKSDTGYPPPGLKSRYPNSQR